ncbi:DNA polymerase III subunit alpha [Desulfobulbus rhabdoformis]|nr:DNA polymerase III subunit alpha [Desulfobulbus rhabdoformis]
MIALGLHSSYSLMQGTASPQALCRYAKAQGYSTLGMTDCNNLYGLWRFLEGCREEGLRPIIGAELSTGDHQRLFALVKDTVGFSNLCQLLSKCHQHPQFCLKTALETHHQGVVLLATDNSMLRFGREIEADILAGLVAAPTQHNSALRLQAKKLGLGCIALQDSYFLNARDEPLHRLVRAIELNTSFERVPADSWKPKGMLPSATAWKERFAIWPESLRAALDVAERCSLTTPYQGLIMPPWSGQDALGELRQRAFAGAGRRYGQPLPPEVNKRLEHELSVIESMGFSTYFLVVHDIVGPVARTCGRGSGAASLVAYCLHITNVCPLRHNLYFERFLNPGRSDPPDIDIDFAWDERDAMLKSVLSRFGCRAAMVANHVTLQPRAAIRETAKVFGLPDGEINRVCRKLPWTWRSQEAAGDFLTQLRNLPQLRDADLSGPWAMILQLAARISGVPRYLSVHPGGVVITPKPVCDYVPVQQAAKGVPTIQWEKDGAEEAGLVKIDLLGNRSLGVIRDALSQLRAEGSSLDESRWVPEDDPPTRETVAQGRTMGCFYIESPATRLLQQRSQRGDFQHLVIHSSIIRPAANEFIREYLRRLHGGSWQPLHPLVGGVLDETYGIMVYQEDVSRVAVRFGFSHGDADRLRKIMSKKDKALQLRDYQQKFLAAATRRSVPPQVAEKIWAMMMSFHGYSFCKPHSASYARVSFQAAYLKTHFPAQFMAAVLSNQGGFYSAFAYVSEARRLGLEILPPCVNQSEIQWQGRGQVLRVGLMAISGGGGETCQRSCHLREKGEFRSVFDWLSRVQPARDEAQAFVHAGALDALHPEATTNRGLLVWLLAVWFQGKKRGHALFPLDPSPPPLPAEVPRERLRNQYRVLGFLCQLHPITLFAHERHRLQTRTSHELATLPANAVRTQKRLRYIGWLITGKLVSTKKGEAMEFLSFEDETGLVECTLFSKAYARYCHLISTCGPFLLSGYLDEDFGVRTFTIEHLRPLRLDRARGKPQAEGSPIAAESA